jgi:HD-GYP domain-containing protein (c-di-GMP phosphodiesterase class II)
MPTTAASDSLLQVLASRNTPSDKLLQLHDILNQRVTDIDRISVALYDAQTDLVRTFIHSSGNHDPLPHHQARLATSRSLKAIAENRTPRVINNLSLFGQKLPPHAMALLRHGYQSSYTLPIFQEDQLLGFIFFDSRKPDVMSGDTLYELDVLGHLISLMVSRELQTVCTLKGIVRAMGSITQFRDVETATHLARMSRFARLIARQLARRNGLTDEFVEYVFLFAPLHDIGKIAIPDSVLLKPGKLDDHELEVMRSHATRGREMIDMVLQDMQLFSLPQLTILRNLVEHHHEAWDGSGYPHGLAGEAIPLEARIVTVADVFDALVSRRPYKPAWTNEAALDHLRLYAGSRFDPACVQALADNLAAVEEIQARFERDD